MFEYDWMYIIIIQKSIHTGYSHCICVSHKSGNTHELYFVRMCVFVHIRGWMDVNRWMDTYVDYGMPFRWQCSAFDKKRTNKINTKKGEEN